MVTISHPPVCVSINWKRRSRSLRQCGRRSRPALRERITAWTEAYCEPKPDPFPPIIVGAFGPKMLRLTAKYADGWNVSSTGIHQYRHLVAEFEHACAEVGRDPATVRRSWCGGCICVPTQAQAEHLAGARYRADEDDFSFVGTPRQVLEQMRAFINLGVDYFMVDCSGFPSLTTLELLVSEVVPTLNHQTAII